MMPSWRVRRNPKIDSEMLEHAYVSITLHTDSRSLPDMREKSAQAIEEALEAVMNSISNGLGMRKTGIPREPNRPCNPHYYAIFTRVHNSL
jgi:hypothetical protein